MKLTRRQLAGMAVAAPALAQTQPADSPSGADQSARDNNKRNSDTLARVEIPVATEPAFQFKA